MVVPRELLQSLQRVDGFDRAAFERVHASKQQLTSIRINPIRLIVDYNNNAVLGIPGSRFSIDEKVPWSSYGFYLTQRPSFTFDPLFHAGCYYVQEASSMFLEQALKQTIDVTQPLKVLDLCAAPGGKSTHIQSLLSKDSLLVSNEVIKNRAGILKQNIIKWGCENVVVSNNDPQHFSRLESFFDVLVVDAPCSGSGLFRKDEEAIKEWSPDNVLLCCGRQKRIIADAFASLKENGILIYSTCSYSTEEDEDIADWLVSELEMKNEKLEIEEGWGIVETVSAINKSFGYRFFPDKLKGEGFYLACFRKTTGEEKKLKPAKLEKPVAKEKEALQWWIKRKEIVLFKGPYIYALPAHLEEEYCILKNVLNVQYAGVAVGEVMKERLVPEHALALSDLLSDNISRIELSIEDAVRYLQRQDVSLSTSTKGWQVITYKNHNLGWVNALVNRINNYYPKELRILKQRDETAFEK